MEWNQMHTSTKIDIQIINDTLFTRELALELLLGY
jgi:hypothetical protein